MTINLYSKSIRNDFSGPFTACDFIGGYIDRSDKTNYSEELFNSKNEKMNNEQLRNELKTILKSKFNGDVNLLAKAVGVQYDEIHDFMIGKSGPPPELIKELENRVSKSVDNMQIGDTVKYIEINNSGFGYTNNYEGMIKGDVDVVKRDRMEIADLHKMLKEKDEIIKSKDETIKSKDETIKSLKKSESENILKIRHKR